jgi:NAD(P)-dependent dehydrogenase (short-subunit alcohol dehydrogenase family)/pimeloyl-ACP methyl ester carboxylesterase
MTAIKYRSADADGLKIFYREAGAADAPALLLLHGFPSASHMFRDLIPLLADRFHIVAPDLPGFGQSDMPVRDNFTYTFDHIAGVIDRFTEVIGLKRFAIYVFDYGAPTGFRIAVKHPDRITAIISQNGNAYEEGLSEGWNPIRAYWQEPSQANREALRAFLAPETTRWQYTHGVADEATVSPDGLSLDNFYLARPGADEIQLDLFGDYKSNIALYPTFQNYFRTHKPPFLAVWGKNDPFFLPPGAEALSATFPVRTFASSTPAISRWRRMPQRSPQRYANSSPAIAKTRGHHMSTSVAIVTGASQGIGRSTAIRLARDFSSIVLAARDRPNLERTADAVKAAGSEPLAVDIDLSEMSAAKSLVDQTLSAFGRIDALLHIAGAVPQIDLFEMTDAQWDSGLALKLHGARRLTIAAWPALKEAKGSVVLMSGNSALFPKAPYAAVGTINAAIVALAKAFSDRGIADGVQVNSVLPGPVMTGRRRSYLAHWAPLHNMTVEEATAKFPEEAGIARYREPEEIAELMAFLVSPLARWMTGSTLRMDGGEVKSV